MFDVVQSFLVWSLLHVIGVLVNFLSWTGSYRHDGEDGCSSCVSEQDVNEGDDLQSFAQTHAVCQDAAEPTAGLITLQRLHQVIVQETDTTNLQCMERESRTAMLIFSMQTHIITFYRTQITF